MLAITEFKRGECSGGGKTQNESSMLNAVHHSIHRVGVLRGWEITKGRLMTHAVRHSINSTSGSVQGVGKHRMNAQCACCPSLNSTSGSVQGVGKHRRNAE